MRRLSTCFPTPRYAACEQCDYEPLSALMTLIVAAQFIEYTRRPKTL